MLKMYSVFSSYFNPVFDNHARSPHCSCECLPSVISSYIVPDRYIGNYVPISRSRDEMDLWEPQYPLNTTFAFEGGLTNGCRVFVMNMDMGFRNVCYSILMLIIFHVSRTLVTPLLIDRTSAPSEISHSTHPFCVSHSSTPPPRVFFSNLSISTPPSLPVMLWRARHPTEISTSSNISFPTTDLLSNKGGVNRVSPQLLPLTSATFHPSILDVMQRERFPTVLMDHQTLLLPFTRANYDDQSLFAPT